MSTGGALEFCLSTNDLFSKVSVVEMEYLFKKHGSICEENKSLLIEPQKKHKSQKNTLSSLSLSFMAHKDGKYWGLRYAICRQGSLANYERRANQVFLSSLSP